MHRRLFLLLAAIAVCGGANPWADKKSAKAESNAVKKDLDNNVSPGKFANLCNASS